MRNRGFKKGPGRPRTPRNIKFSPKVYYFKPRGVSLRHLKSTEISMEEIEAVRLKYIDKLGQEQCAERMNVSQSTFQRILSGANEKISSALVRGYAIKIIKEE